MTNILIEQLMESHAASVSFRRAAFILMDNDLWEIQ